MTSIITREISANHALLLSEPVPARDGSAVDWYIDEEEGELVALSELDSADAETLRRQLASEMTDVLDRASALEETAGTETGDSRVAANLRLAMTFPGEESIWAVKTSDGLRPIIVAWGYEPHDTGSGTPFSVSTFAPKRSTPPRRRNAGNTQDNTAGINATGTTTGVGGGGVGAGQYARGNSATHGRGWLSWLLGLLTLLAFLLLLALIAGYLLPACGLRTPFGTINFGLPGRMGCGQTQQAQVIAGEYDALDRELRVLQDEYTRRRLQCVPAIEVIPEPVEVLPEPEEVLPINDDDAEFDERIDDRGETQVTLIWSTNDDLDLYLKCPNGAQIYHAKKVACGGILDVDANYQSVVESPVENITMGEEMDTGQYRVRVKLYNSRSNTYPLPFKVRIQDNEGVRVIDGVLRSEKEIVDVADFVK